MGKRRLKLLSACLFGGLLVLGPARADERAEASDTRTPTALIAKQLERHYGHFLGDGELTVQVAQALKGSFERASNVRFDPRGGRFSAVLWQGQRPVGVTGQAWVEVSAPVPAKRLEPGTVVGPDDLTTVRMPAKRMTRGAYSDGDALIGMEVVRTLYPGRTIARSALRAPLAVERNQVITLVYATDGLRLTAKGRALKDGSVGQVIPVHNASGDRVVDARITGDRRAEVY